MGDQGKQKRKPPTSQLGPGLLMMILSAVSFLVREKPLSHWVAGLHEMRGKDATPPLSC